MGAFKSVWTQAATYPTEAQVQTGVDFGPTGADFTGTLVADGGSAPTTPGTLIGQLITLNEQGAVEQGAEVTIQIVTTDGGRGTVADAIPWTETSNADGLVEFDGMLKGWTYAVWRGDLRYPTPCLVPTDPEDYDGSGRFSINSLIGIDGA